MVRHIDSTTPTVPAQQDRVQRRHTIAALVYFVYGVFYLFGAQYLTSMQATQRGMGNAQIFFALGGLITVLFPLLIYSRFALALSFYWQPRAHRKTLYINFTLLLGLLVIGRVIGLAYSGLCTKTPLEDLPRGLRRPFIIMLVFFYDLWRGGLCMKTPLHTVALVVAAINAACLVWASVSRPVWVTREAEGSSGRHSHVGSPGEPITDRR